jgi:rod shape determining protein RodA
LPKQILPYLKQCDWVMLSLALAIAAVGVAEIYSATQYELSETYYVKQIYYILLGLVVLALVVSLDYRLLSQQVPYIYLVAVLSLLLVLFVAPFIHGTRGWIPLGAFKIQPAEFAKVAIVLTLARFLSENRTHFLTSVEIVKACLLVGLPLGLILLQPDLGSAITLAPPLAVGLVLGGLRRRWILAGVVLATLITAAGWYSLKPYQKERVYTFLEPERDPRGHGYQAIQSQIAMGSGGLLGKGVTRGSQTALGFLPERHTDFIFSVVGEELGFAGSFVILAFYFLIIMRSIRIAQTARDKLGVFLVLGSVSVLFFHILVNVGMVVGLAPITGIPLPLLSYGGSSMLTTFILLGLIVNVGMRRYVY